RGPKNSSLNHWSEPKVTVDRRSKSRWLFKCQYCDQIRTFPRMLKESDNTNGSRDELQFKDEPQQPQLGNLATHTKEHAGLIERRESERKGRQGQGSEGCDVGGLHTGFTLASAKLMEKYVQDGLLNPRVEPTQPGFTRLFAAWLIEQDLPFTTGESGSIKRLFKYIQCRFSLPSDTTITHATDTWTSSGMINAVLSRIVGRKLMELYHVPFHPNNSHIHCLAHVVNLIAQKMLSVAKDVDDPELQDYYESLNKQFPVHYDLDNNDELQDFENKDDDGSKAQGNLSDGLIDQESGEQDHFGGMGAIEKVCLLRNTSKARTAIYSNDQLCTAIVKIVGTPGRRQLFREKAK
ncbi:hypothetical protein EI94DRAFT_1602044, partial [Lactarius quietus]